MIFANDSQVCSLSDGTVTARPFPASEPFKPGNAMAGQCRGQRLQRFNRTGGDRQIALVVPELLPLGQAGDPPRDPRSEEHTSELQSLMRISYAVFCLQQT